MTQPETEPWTDGEPAGDVPFTGAIGKYQVQRVLGTGGEGVVLAAYDTELGRSVAIKFRVRDSEEGQQRLIREAQAMAQLHHPNVVTVHEVLRLEKRTGIVMALIDGSDLRRWRESPRTWREIVAVYLQAARGLAAAHRAGLVHRDFKPSNAMIDADGVVRVSDFGLARIAGEAPAGSGELATGSALTRTGAVVGTPAYIAPEQRSGGRVDARADQYSFAVALYEALAEKRPEPSRPESPPGPRWLRRVVMRALAQDPDPRFPSMAEVVGALEAGLARRRRWAMAAVAVVVIGGVGAVALRRSGPDEPPPATTWMAIAIGNEPGDSASRAIAISRDGTTIAYASDTDVVVEPRAGGARAHIAIPAAIGPPESVALSRTGDRVLVAVRRHDQTLEIWETVVAGGMWERRRLPGSTALRDAWDLDPAGNLAIVESRGNRGDRLVRVDHTGTERVLAETDMHYRTFAFSFDGARVAATTDRGENQIVDVATGRVDVIATKNFCVSLDWLGPDSLECGGGEDQRIIEMAIPHGAGQITATTRYTAPPYVSIGYVRATEAGLLIVEESIETHLHIFDLEHGTRRMLSTGSVIDIAPVGWTPSGW